MSEHTPRKSVQRVLAACSGGDAAVIVRSIQAMGLEAIAAFDEATSEAPWVQAADWDAPLLARDAEDDPWSDPQRLVSAALDAGADALHPGAGTSAASAALARLTIASGLGWLGVQPELLESWTSAVEQAAAQVGVLRDRDEASGLESARVGVLGDGHRMTLLGQQSLLAGGLAEVTGCTDAIARAALALGSALRLNGIASFDLVELPGGRVVILGAHPALSGWFMFDEALSANLVAAQVQLAAGEDLQWDSERPTVRPTVAAVVRTTAPCEWAEDTMKLDPAQATMLVGPGPVPRSTPVALIARSGPTLQAARARVSEALLALPLPNTNAASVCARLFGEPT